MDRIENSLALGAAIALLGFSVVHAEDSSKAAGDTASSGTFVDQRDGQAYTWKKIGETRWMTQNLNYKIDKSLCFLDDTANCENLGRLYAHSDAKKVCPQGWRLPKERDWFDLFAAAGQEKYSAMVINGHLAAVYNKLKAREGWDSARGALAMGKGTRDGNGTDDYGFAALPGGTQITGSYSKPNQMASFWMVEKGNIVYGCHVDFLSTGGYFAYGISNCSGIAARASVRCVEE